MASGLVPKMVMTLRAVGRAGGAGVHLTYASCTTSTVRVVLAQSSRCLSVRHTARHPAGTHM